MSLPATYENRAQVKSEKHYLTTAIAYLNGPPHVGHAYEYVGADIISRYNEGVGRHVRYMTGSDEHGQKVENKAKANNISPQEWCDKTVESFKSLNTKLNVGHHVFLRTTTPEHMACAQWLWKRCRDRGDIYKGVYKGWYNVKEEAFITDREAEANGFKDPDTGVSYEQRDEETFFFRMSKYHDRVEHLLSETGFLQPESRRNEILARLKKDRLEDLCVSRSTLNWGVPVPDEPGHVMYVWFDALSCYLSNFTIKGFNDEGDFCDEQFGAAVASDSNPPPFDPPAFKKFWPPDVQIIGKDITWFHCVIWPSLLMSAGIQLPHMIFGHGFVQAADGQKMSKSLGNCLSPMDVLEKVGSDTFRYYLTKEGTYGADIRFSQLSLIDMHNSDLCSVIGNLVHRVVALGGQACNSMIPTVEPERAIVDLPAIFTRVEASMARCALEELALVAIEMCKDINKYLTEQAPWKIKIPQDETPATTAALADDCSPAASAKQTDGAKTPSTPSANLLAKKQSIIRASLEAVYIAAHFLWPIIPQAADKIFERLGQDRMLICDLQPTANLRSGTMLRPTKEVLFEHLE